jgi:hypothetical protein
MSLQSDQAAKNAKRALAHANHVVQASMPAGAPVDSNTDVPTVLAVDSKGVVIAPIAYPSPPF